MTIYLATIEATDNAGETYSKTFTVQEKDYREALACNHCSPDTSHPRVETRECCCPNRVLDLCAAFLAEQGLSVSITWRSINEDDRLPQLGTDSVFSAEQATELLWS